MGWQIIHLICTSEKQKYLFKKDWTGQISLIRLDKSDFTRKPWKRDNRIWKLEAALKQRPCKTRRYAPPLRNATQAL
jgi:hypothetical protein